MELPDTVCMDCEHLLFIEHVSSGCAKCDCEVQVRVKVVSLGDEDDADNWY